MELNSDLLVNGGIGLASGAVAGYVLKKTMGFIFKAIMVLFSIFVVALIYLEHIKVIAINERSLDNLLNATYSNVNNVIGPDAVVNPATYIMTNLGIPLTSGLAIGFCAGFLKG
jgi:uncharacterized membrane protein (Fun14 family)